MIERVKISKGLSIPIKGEPEQKVYEKSVDRVAIVSGDYLGLRPTMLVAEGDEVKLGQPLIADKQIEGLVIPSPAGGRIQAIHRGAKRRFISMVIDIAQEEAVCQFDSVDAYQMNRMSRNDVAAHIIKLGLWPAFRTRPFSKIPSPQSVPAAIFVNAMDSNPLAAQPRPIILNAIEDFRTGLRGISKLTEGSVFLCQSPGSETLFEPVGNIRVVEFLGPHPSGLPGTHMHFLRPASLERINWHLNYQDVISIGRAFNQGSFDPTRFISLAGTSVTNPRLIKTRLGASLEQLVAGELDSEESRVISGSILCGQQREAFAEYLGRYHLQVSCLSEGNKRELLGWQKPGFNKFSITRAFAGAWTGAKKFALTTSTEGSERAMVPIGTYEKVMPIDVLPTLLLRALISRDTVRAQELGCLEFDEEDLALCTFVCPGKYDYGTILRENLAIIEREG
jgi:Na+-transporting NADH:ubiquinone oxidoreductase subunit A